MEEYIELQYGNKTFFISRDDFIEFCLYYKEEIIDLFRDDINALFNKELKDYFYDRAQESFELQKEQKSEINKKRFRED